MVELDSGTVETLIILLNASGYTRTADALAKKLAAALESDSVVVSLKVRGPGEKTNKV